MKRLPRLSVEYFTLNFKVLPAPRNPKKYYSSLIEKLFKSHNAIEYGNDFVYRLTKLHNFNKGEVYYGVISKFLRKDGIEWVETDSEDVVDYSIPDNIDGRKASYEFVFHPAKHKFAFIKKGRIDPDTKRRGAPLKIIVNILKIGFDLILDAEKKECEVNIVQSDQIFDEIFSNPVKSLDVTVSYSNPGLGEDHEKTMDEFLRKSHIGKTRINMQPDSTGSIETDTTFTKGLIDLARQNGKVKAKIETQGGVKTINTEDHPEVTEATIEVSEQTNIIHKFIKTIVSQLTR